MKEIDGLIVTQIRVFAVDIIPIRLIGTKSCIQRLKSDLCLDEVDIAPFSPGGERTTFTRGEVTEKGKIVAINRISIEPRRVLLEVAGTSQEANQIYTLLLKSIESATCTNLAKLETPLILSETTQCVATLDFPFDSLLDSSFAEFIYGRVTKVATSNIARASIRPALAEFEISYDVKAQTVIKNKITLSPKRLTIAPRANTPIEERRYFISSPFDSDTHLKLIRDLERLIANKHSS